MTNIIRPTIQQSIRQFKILALWFLFGSICYSVITFFPTNYKLCLIISILCLIVGLLYYLLMKKMQYKQLRIAYEQLKAEKDACYFIPPSMSNLFNSSRNNGIIIELIPNSK